MTEGPGSPSEGHVALTMSAGALGGRPKSALQAPLQMTGAGRAARSPQDLGSDPREAGVSPPRAGPMGARTGTGQDSGGQSGLLRPTDPCSVLLGGQGVHTTYLFQQVLVGSDEQLLLSNPLGILRKSTKHGHVHGGKQTLKQPSVGEKGRFIRNFL